MKGTNKFVLVDGIRTHYYDEGRGFPLLLLHGGEFGACAELTWEFTLTALAEHYRVIAPDWLGYGETDKLYDFEDGQGRMLSHMRRFMHIMEVEESHVVGHSMGAGLLSRSLAATPEAYRIKSLVMIAGGGFNPDNEHRRTMMNYDGTTTSMKAMLKSLFHDPKWSVDPEYLNRRVAWSLRPGAWETIAATRFKNPNIPVLDFFGRADDTPYQNIDIPTLVIAGDEDRLRLPGWEKELSDKISGSKTYVVKESGHYPQIERPEEVNAAVLEFLSRVSV